MEAAAKAGSPVAWRGIATMPYESYPPTPLVKEFFAWRALRNRREVAALAGLVGTPYNSPGYRAMQRELTAMIESRPKDEMQPLPEPVGLG